MDETPWQERREAWRKRVEETRTPWRAPELQSQEFRWYLLGCRNVGFETALDREQFQEHYDRYKRCCKAIERYETRKRRQISRRRGATYRDDAFMERLIKTIREEQEMLRPLAAAVALGQALDGGSPGSGGAGVPAPRYPNQPPLVGSAAKILPPLDPEPWMRDP